MSSLRKDNKDECDNVYTYTNPFVHKVDMGNSYNKLKIAVFTVLIFPFRLILAISCLMLATLVAKISTRGLSSEDISKEPLTGWRRLIRNLALKFYRLAALVSSLHYVKKIGKQVSAKQAPFLVVAPHSTIFDGIILGTCATPLSGLAKAELKLHPIWRTFFDCTQSIYVDRGDRNSRQNTIKAITERVNSPLEWPQIMIFVEGACTNGSSLLKFKNGAFLPGLPVQPAVFRYLNKFNSVTWTWMAPSPLKMLWLTMCQFHTYCELEFLPVYVPSEAEKQDPNLFANNVRNVMAKALDMPTSDYSVDDHQLMVRAKQLNIPNEVDIVEIEKFRNTISIKQYAEEKILNSRSVNSNNCYVSLSEFAKQLQISTNDASTRLLFSLFRKGKSKKIDFRHYLLSAIFINNSSAPAIELLESISKIYETKVDSVANGPTNGLLNFEGLLSLNQHGIKLSPDDCAVIFNELDKQNRKLISFHDLKKWLSSKDKHSHLFKAKFLRKMKSQ